MRNARHEMDEVLFRTALSPGIREQHDEFPLIADPSGKMVVGQFGLSIPDFLDGFDGDIGEGDVLLTSDPYACGAAISHANDWLVVMPIFESGHLVGWSSMFGHMSDVGGKSPSSMPTDATTIYEEGVVIPPFKLYRAGEPNEDALRIILNQVRMPDWNRADLNGLVAACRTAGRRVQEMCTRFGAETYLSALDLLLARNYTAMKALLHMVFEEVARCPSPTTSATTASASDLTSWCSRSPALGTQCIWTSRDHHRRPWGRSTTTSMRTSSECSSVFT